MKRIYFCLDGISWLHIPEDVVKVFAMGFESTEKHIVQGVSIATFSMAHFSFDLLRMDYEIYLCYKDKQIKIEPHMKSSDKHPYKDITTKHNLLKLFMGGVFDEILGYKRDNTNIEIIKL